MERDFKCGEIKIFFGKVVDVKDSEKLLRIRVSIDGLTDEIAKDDLPWYFPWYGINYLPQENDVVPVIQFDDNISTCFYGSKVDTKYDKISDDDYANYLEIFSRSVDGKLVELKYTKTKGIEFVNDIVKIQIETSKLTLFCDSNYLEVTKDKINLGDGSKEATPLGDKTVKELHAIIMHQSNTITAMMTIYKAIAAVCVTPFTAPIGAVINAQAPTFESQLKTENQKVDKQADTIQSKKVFIE